MTQTTSASSIPMVPSANMSKSIFWVGAELIWVPFGIAVFGFLGNALAFLTIVLSDLRKNYVFSYVVVLLVSDSLFMLNCLALPLRLDTVSFWSCALTEFIPNTTGYLSSFAIVSLTLERFFSIVFPLQHLNYSANLKRSKTIAVWVACTVVWNFNVVYALKSTDDDEYIALIRNSVSKNIQCEYDFAKMNAYPLFFWPRLFFSFLFPLLVEIFVSAETRERHLILFIIPAVYILLNLPYSVRSLLKFVLDSVSYSSIYSNHYLLYTGCLYIYCLNFAINCIIYALASSMFRAEFSRMWLAPFQTKLFGSRNANVVVPMTTIHVKSQIKTVKL